jgi:hypothetical protein
MLSDYVERKDRPTRLDKLEVVKCITAEPGCVIVGFGGSSSGDANLVLASPDGMAGATSLRKLVLADLPNPIDVGTF